MYTEKISLIDDDADDAGAAAAVPDWEMSEEFLDHAKARHLLCNYHTTIVPMAALAMSSLTRRRRGSRSGAVA